MIDLEEKLNRWKRKFKVSLSTFLFRTFFRTFPGISISDFVQNQNTPPTPSNEKAKAAQTGFQNHPKNNFLSRAERLEFKKLHDSRRNLNFDNTTPSNTVIRTAKSSRITFNYYSII